jgi:hypothetical protein
MKHLLKRPAFLRGGEAEGMYIEDFDPEQLRIGQQHELEHTKVNSYIALLIAADHLAEDPDYYHKLEKAGL